MKRLFLLCLIAVPAFAADAPALKLGDKADKMVRDALPICSDEAKVTESGLEHKLPVNLTGNVVRIESKRQTCDGQWVVATTANGSFYIGSPWFLDNVEGTLEQKLTSFTWNVLKEKWTASVDMKNKTAEGFYPVRMNETTERGPLPFDGLVDPTGTIFLFGHFFPLNGDVRSSRVKALEPFLHDSPVTGAASPKVTVVEFSDFECPSCKRAAGYMKPILAKYGDQVRYVRYDLPLIGMHPWALTAAVAGRAIYHQKPELFWEFKEQIYENQDKLNAFVVDDWLRNFAKDHDLDLAKYDADVASQQLRDALVNGAGNALSNDVRATPTYMVNGAFVDAGDGGKALEEYVAKLLK